MGLCWDKSNSNWALHKIMISTSLYTNGWLLLSSPHSFIEMTSLPLMKNLIKKPKITSSFASSLCVLMYTSAVLILTYVIGLDCRLTEV